MADSLPIQSPRSLTGAQRRALRGLGHHLKPVVQIGGFGLTEAVVAATRDALAHHELIKISTASEAPVDRKAAPLELARLTGAHVAQVIGRTALLYRRRPGDPTVALPGRVDEVSTSTGDA